MFCYVATTNMPRDLLGNGPDMSSLTWRQTPRGPAMSSALTPSNSTLSTKLLPYAGLSLMFAGEWVDPGGNFGGSVGLVDRTSSYNTFYSLSFGGYGDFDFRVNNGALGIPGATTLTMGWPSNPLVYPTLFSAAGTYAPGGTMRSYLSGVQVASQSAPASAPVYGSDGSLSMVDSAAGFNVSIMVGYSQEKTAAEVAWFNAEPFAMLRPVGAARRFYLVGASALATITGTITQTQADQSIVAAGAVRVAGSLAQTQADQTVSATGAVPTHGAIVQTQADQAISATGVSGAVGSIVQTQAAQTVAATGTVLTHGAIAQTQADQAISAAGGVLNRGAIGQTQANQSIVATGVIFTGGPVTGTIAQTQADQAIIAAGTVSRIGFVFGSAGGRHGLKVPGPGNHTLRP